MDPARQILKGWRWNIQFSQGREPREGRIIVSEISIYFLKKVAFNGKSTGWSEEVRGKPFEFLTNFFPRFLFSSCVWDISRLWNWVLGVPVWIELNKLIFIFYWMFAQSKFSCATTKHGGTQRSPVSQYDNPHWIAITWLCKWSNVLHVGKTCLNNNVQ